MGGKTLGTQGNWDRPNQPPSDGLQFFGHVAIAGDTGVMTVELKNLVGKTLYSVDLAPVGG